MRQPGRSECSDANTVCKVAGDGCDGRHGRHSGNGGSSGSESGGRCYGSITAMYLPRRPRYLALGMRELALVAVKTAAGLSELGA